jgi:hypothetical protein
MSDITLNEKKYIHFVPHPDDSWYDTCVIDTIERWKESGLSGDEYRFSYRVSFIRKGQVLLEKSYGSWKAALAFVPGLSYNDYPAGADSEHEDSPVIQERYSFCFQPGCPELATREFRILKLYTDRGHEIEMSNQTDYRFRFCEKHAQHRGDCGLLDSDSNLVEVPFGSDPNVAALNPKEN